MKNDLDANLNHRLAIVVSLQKRLMYRVILDQNIPVSPDHWTLLHYLSKTDGLTLSELALLSSKEVAFVGRLIDGLTKLGYARKELLSQNECKVYLTDEGKEIQEKIARSRSEASVKMLHGISDEQQEMMVELLRTIERNILNEL